MKVKMITKEKHFTKCETPSSSRIVEDRKPVNKLPNGNLEATNNAKNSQISAEKSENAEGNKVVVNEASKNAEGRQTPKDAAGDDAAANASQKVGTVIPNRIFVGGFSVKTIDDDLYRFFSTISHITGAKIIYDRTGMSKCYGFVTFANPKDAKGIVKQTGGIMFSPMGRLRISQAVRKQLPHYPVHPSDYNGQVSVPGQQEGYYPSPPCPTKPPVCIGYPVQPIHPVHHLPTVPHASQNQTTVHPHVTSAQTTPPVQNNPPSVQTQPRSAPSTSPRSSTAGSSESGTHSNQSHSVNSYPDNVYPGPMIAGPPTYVIPSMMPYPPPSLPAYDATGLYTTCPGYAQPMAAYPYAVVLQPQPREGTPATYASPYGPAPIAYVPQAPPPCYVRDTSGKAAPTHYPVINSYIF